MITQDSGTVNPFALMSFSWDDPAGVRTIPGAKDFKNLTVDDNGHLLAGECSTAGGSGNQGICILDLETIRLT